jgi:hypothetical protein
MRSARTARPTYLLASTRSTVTATGTFFEALAPDPTRLDALTWITSYASIYNSRGNPLFDLMAQAKRGEDPRMYFSWYSADYCTDLGFADLEPEAKANPSMASWNNPGYLAQQRRRLPSHKFRRLHLNFPGMPDGAFLDAARVMDAVVEGRKVLRPVVPFAAAVSDLPGGQTDSVRVQLTPQGKKLARTLIRQGKKKLKGVMEINNHVGGWAPTKSASRYG